MCRGYEEERSDTSGDENGHLPGNAVGRSSDTISPDGDPLVKAKTTGPLSWVTLLGSILSVALFILSFVFGDGMSLLATLLLSGLSTLIGLGNKWELHLPRRPKGGDPPEGDVVIRYPNGSYLVVRCDEEVARELYFAPEEIKYNMKCPAAYRIISLIGTLMLMLGVILLANARLQLQFCWAGAYIILNAAHWIGAALPQRMHWDLSCYDIREQSVVGGPKNPNFIEALWKAMLLSKNVRWVRHGDAAAPQTDVWDQWLKIAEVMAKSVDHHIGELIDPLWTTCSKNEKGGVWDVPRDWQAKASWDGINEQDTVEPITARNPPLAHHVTV